MSVVSLCYRFVNSMVYYGVSLYSSNLAGDKYLNFFLLSVVEIPGYVVTMFTMMWYVHWSNVQRLICMSGTLTQY